ncbi:hypothetical protein EV193_112165 [Herbihabitans rhizosphaerae]|uniref:DUF8017 domain-containing protein n=1 Tax=Herbihabitans rhizosphaerae TaxID=1872711 RepID=A0A4Q7KEL9_9PSEU|nr:hypothetical protein [Herbihabitans rhizosphaerae]RZS32531.1 hypothetical protein EV193_112165 [Herbihabitans rhizosphaerae]
MSQPGPYGHYPPPYPAPPPPPRRSRTPLIVTLIAVLLVGAGVATTLILVNRDKGGGTQTSAGQQPTDEAEPSPGDQPPRPELEKDANGWLIVPSRPHGASYSVPPDKDWLAEPARFQGYRLRPMEMHVITTYKQGACGGHPESRRARMGFIAQRRPTDPAAAATEAAKGWAENLAAGIQGAVPSPPQTSTKPVAQGSIQATVATVALNVGKADDCNPPTIQLTAVGFASGTRTVVFLIEADHQTPNAPPPAVLDKVIASLRPLR